MSPMLTNILRGKYTMENVAATAPKKRDAFIDFAKAIGIIFIVFAHINLSGALYTTFYAFHIPLFFVIAGLTFSDGAEGKTFGRLLGQKAKKLLIPYLIYAVITFIWWACVENNLSATKGDVLGSFVQIFLAQGSTEYMLHNPALWFLPCFFLSEVIYYPLRKCRTGVRVTASVCLAVVGFCMSSGFMPAVFQVLPWSAEVAFSAILFICIGDLIGKNGGREKLRNVVMKKPAVSFIICALLVAALYFLSNLNGKVSMGSNVLGNPALFYVNAFIGTTAVIIFAILTERVLSKNVSANRSALQWIGIHTFEIMSIHFPIKRLLVRFVAKISGTSVAFVSNSLPLSSLAFVGTFVLTVIIVIAVNAFVEAVRVREFSKADS